MTAAQRQGKAMDLRELAVGVAVAVGCGSPGSARWGRQDARGKVVPAGFPRGSSAAAFQGLVEALTRNGCPAGCDCRD